MLSWVIFGLLLVIGHFTLITATQEVISDGNNVIEYYAIVVDAGSTGSRSFIFDIKEVVAPNDQILSRSLTSIKGKKIVPGLSDFATQLHEPDAIVRYFLPIFERAATIVPSERINGTKVFIKGTAGMRLLSDDDQNTIWKILHDGLNNHPSNPFKIELKNLGTISGHLEAYYAVLSANFIAGSIDANLKATGEVPLVGALDMGGSSTQLIFYTGDETNVAIHPDNFWSHSWLNFGVDKIRERLNKQLVSEGVNHANTEETESGLVVIHNPCYFQGYDLAYDTGIIVRGSGDSVQCMNELKNLLWPNNSCIKDAIVDDQGLLMNKQPCYLDGVEHPPIRGQFYGMSVYFFAMDCVRHLGSKALLSWPNPTIDELEEATHEFCSFQWDDIQEIVATEGGKHKYTFSTQLPHRCLESLYIALLLEDGFGFHGAGRNIHLALEVKGKEVEWSLGYALSEIHSDGILPVVPSPERTLAIKAPESPASSTLSGLQRLLLAPFEILKSLWSRIKDMLNGLFSKRK